jgi:hypothetical protein
VRPFAARYAVRDERYDDWADAQTRYDVAAESLVLAHSGQLLIDRPDMLARATGTYITKAGGDPTRDEPTDR